MSIRLKWRKVTARFFGEKFVRPKYGDLGPKWRKNRVFGLLWKIESKVLAGNTLQWSVLLSSNISQKPHIWENSVNVLGMKRMKADEFRQRSCFNLVYYSSCRPKLNVSSVTHLSWVQVPLYPNLLEIDLLFIANLRFLLCYRSAAQPPLSCHFNVHEILLFWYSQGWFYMV